jgi:sulfur carrier protein
MSQPELTVNGEAMPWRPGLVVAELVDALLASTRGVAVAVDREVIPRSAWAVTPLEPGAAVEIVSAAAGG